MSEQTVYQQFAEALGQGNSRVVPEIFKVLADEDEAAIVMAASPPRTISELASETGLDESTVEGLIGPLFTKGLIFKSKKPDATRYYRVRNIMQFHDSTGVILDPPDGLLDLWLRWNKEDWVGANRQMEEGLSGPAMRVIPVNLSIDYNSQILAIDDVTTLVENAQDIAVTQCTCRVVDGDCGKPLWNCIQLDKAARYALERGTGKPLTKEETIDLLRECEEEGLVHTAGATQAAGHVICNCCSDCCINWTSIRDGLGKFIVPSRFKAEIQEDECTGCELCIDSCYFDAMHMLDDKALVAVHPDKCMGCGLCQVVCVPEAIEMNEVRPKEHIPAVPA